MLNCREKSEGSGKKLQINFSFQLVFQLLRKSIVETDSELLTAKRSRADICIQLLALHTDHVNLEHSDRKNKGQTTQKASTGSSHTHSLSILPPKQCFFILNSSFPTLSMTHENEHDTKKWTSLLFYHWR